MGTATTSTATEPNVLDVKIDLRQAATSGMIATLSDYRRESKLEVDAGKGHEAMLTEMRDLHSTISSIPFDTAEARREARQMATVCGAIATGFFTMGERLCTVDGWKRLGALVEDLAIEFEDIAETLALAGSAAFARRVKRDLEQAGVSDAANRA